MTVSPPQCGHSARRHTSNGDDDAVERLDVAWKPAHLCHLRQQLQRDRALAAHHVDVVEGVQECRTGALADGGGCRLTSCKQQDVMHTLTAGCVHTAAV